MDEQLPLADEMWKLSLVTLSGTQHTITTTANATTSSLHDKALATLGHKADFIMSLTHEGKDLSQCGQQTLVRAGLSNGSVINIVKTWQKDDSGSRSSRSWQNVYAPVGERIAITHVKNAHFYSARPVSAKCGGTMTVNKDEHMEVITAASTNLFAAKAVDNKTSARVKEEVQTLKQVMKDTV